MKKTHTHASTHKPTLVEGNLQRGGTLRNEFLRFDGDIKNLLDTSPRDPLTQHSAEFRYLAQLIVPNIFKLLPDFSKTDASIAGQTVVSHSYKKVPQRSKKALN